MRYIFSFILALMSVLPVCAQTYSYRFSSTPLSEALSQVAEDHPEINISFIFDELEKYRISAVVSTDDPYQAIRAVIGLNPVMASRVGDNYYVEALQHGNFVYTGRVVDDVTQPVVAATVLLLAPADSTVLTYAVTDEAGRFSIPCDHRNVIAKITSLGFLPLRCRFDNFHVGTLRMQSLPVSLGGVTVTPDTESLLADRTVYLPSQRQKNSSQTGIDLLMQMAIPQIRITGNDKIESNDGRPVAIFIDYVPASATDLKTMRLSDVKRVEYLQYPSDPRLAGNPCVINFIMSQYDYGGYFKAFGNQNIISSSGQLLGMLRYQRKNMTYDIWGSGFASQSPHTGVEQNEVYRLPAENGETRLIQRHTDVSSSNRLHQQHFVAFRARYNTERIQASSEIDMTLDRRPHDDTHGSVTYSGIDNANGEYTSRIRNNSKYVSYSGNYFFILPGNNSVSLKPTYTFNHTERITRYEETGYLPIDNVAADNTSVMTLPFGFQHDLGRNGKLDILLNGSHEYSRTRYSGSTVSYDRGRSTQLKTGITYDRSFNPIYIHLGAGWNFSRLQLNDYADHPSSPWADLTINYSINKRNSISGGIHYSTQAPSPNFKSGNIIQANPWLSYTGNPALIPSDRYDLELSYTGLPTKTLSYTLFANSVNITDRYAYVYEASPQGVLRTIQQPMGSWRRVAAGANATLRLFDRKLLLSANGTWQLTHNGIPYNYNHSYIHYYAQAYYYAGNLTFGMVYIAPQQYGDGWMNGYMVHSKSDFYIFLGWADSRWNVRAAFFNMNRWNWKAETLVMHSDVYDDLQQSFSTSFHALIQLRATYTFGFGKKVDRSNDQNTSGTTSSGILR